MRIILAAALLAALPLVSDAQTRYSSQPGKSSLKVDGTSTFHDWEMESHVIGGAIEFAPGVDFDLTKGAITGLKDGKLPATVHANMAVSALHSKAEHLPEVMDNIMQQHMKAADFPTIRYTVAALSLTNATPGKPFEFSATGQLSISGVTNSVTFPVSIEQTDPTHLRVKGQYKMKMTDFKIDPPAPHPLGLPTMKCGDDITVIFDWILQKR